MNLRAAPGIIRDSIINYLTSAENASLAEIREAISTELGSIVATSSIRSHLNLNTPDIFERTSRGHYRLRAARGHSTQTTLHPNMSSAEQGLFSLTALIGCARVRSARSTQSLPIRLTGSWNIRQFNKLSYAENEVVFGESLRRLTAINVRLCRDLPC
jgi:hypothetical protein